MRNFGHIRSALVQANDAPTQIKEHVNKFPELNCKVSLNGNKLFIAVSIDSEYGEERSGNMIFPWGIFKMEYAGPSVGFLYYLKDGSEKKLQSLVMDTVSKAGLKGKITEQGQYMHDYPQVVFKYVLE